MNRKKKDRLEQIDVDNIDFSDKKRAFMILFSRQSQEVRESILSDLPAYNALLSLEVESFEELALKVLAEKRGVRYSKVTLLVPDCPFCGKDEEVTKKTGYTYRCRACGRTFAANYNSISSGTKCDALTWMKVLQCMLDFISISETCERCGINKKTYYLIRNHLFYGLQLLMDRVKLYGEIQVDNTFVRVSYKGMSLQATDCSEDSAFYEEPFKPRPGRKRGGSYLMAERSANSICVFTAIDDRGHVMARFAGVGMTNSRNLKHYVPSEKYLLTVPEEDPFRDLLRTLAAEPKTSPGDSSIMVADKEFAIEKYAKSLGVQFESHVYRRNGVQVQHHGETRNIQKVNALHKRLKDFLRKCNYVSSKYLPGYLCLFEFLENCGDSQEAVHALFKILATPNLGKPASFYQDQYSVPSYLLEWFEDESALKKLPYNKLLAYYMYDHIRNKERYPEVEITMALIEKETGYTAPTIRKLYKDLNQAGYHEKILRYFGEPENNPPETKKARKGSATFNPIVLAIYDEDTRVRLLPESQRPRFSDFLEEQNKRYGTSYTRTNMLDKFKKIEASGIRPPRPEYNKENDPLKDRWIGFAVTISKEYEALRLTYRERGEKPPKRFELIEILSKKYELSVNSLDKYITVGKKYRREHGMDN